jgi:hypothetical protein
LFRGLAIRYGWTPEQVGRLTQQQVDMFLEEEEVGMIPFDTMEEAFEFQRRRRSSG